MVKIVLQDGTEVGMTEEPFWIKYGSSGCLTPCGKAEAVGVAFNSTPYNLFGRTDIAGAETALLIDMDGGKDLMEKEAQIAALNEELQESDETAMELYETTLAMQTQLDENDAAILEIYESLEE
jgi:hypothetical protein